MRFHFHFHFHHVHTRLRIDPVNSTPTRVPSLKTWWPESHWGQFASWRCLYCAVSWLKHLHHGTVWQHTVYSVLSASFARSSFFSVAKAPTRFWGRRWCHLHFFVQQKSTVGFGRHQLSRRLRPANIKVSRFGSWFSPRMFLVFIKEGSLLKSGCVSRNESCQGSHRTRSRPPSP